MTYQRLPYEDASTTTEMVADCAVVGRTLGVPSPRATTDGHPAAAGLVVPEDLAELAARLELHLD